MTGLLNGNLSEGKAHWATWVKRGHPIDRVVMNDYALGAGSFEFEGHHETYEAGILQGVSGGPLSKFTLSAYFRFQLSDPTQNPDLTGIRAWVGIDPAGSPDPGSSGLIIRSGDVGRFAYQPLSVTAESVRGDVTVFCGIEAGVADQWKIANLYALIADVTLDIIGGVQLPAPPEAVVSSITLGGILDEGEAWGLILHVPKTK